MEAPDEQLMAAYRDGNAAAFETLYLRHRGRLFRFVLRSVKSRATAEELFQEIWMRVIEARERYAPQARFTTWLYTIAHHRMVDHWGEGVFPWSSWTSRIPRAIRRTRRGSWKRAKPWRGSRRPWRRCRSRSARRSCCTRRRACRLPRSRPPPDRMRRPPRAVCATPSGS